MPITTPHVAMPDLQIAVYNVLTANTAFNALVTGLFDPAPENQPFPYVTFGEHDESSWYTFGNTGRQVLFMFHVWSQQNGFAEAYSILDTIAGALETQTLTLAHFTQAQNAFLFERATKTTESDGITRHVAGSYRVYLAAK